MDHPRTQMPSRQDFSAVVNSSFGVRANGVNSVNFTLVECNSVISNEWQECYSLIFRGPLDQPPIQEIYHLENDQLGKMELLLVPVKRDEHGIYFEAVMNLLQAR
jgi:hypothetical protein